MRVCCPTTLRSRPLFLSAVPPLYHTLGVVFLLSFVLGSAPAVGQTFNAEATLSTADPDDITMRIFQSGHLYIAFVESNEVFLQEGPNFAEFPPSMGTPGVAQRHPGIAISLPGALTVFWEEDDASPGATGPEILYRVSVGGGLGSPTALDPSPLPDLEPALATDVGFGSRDVVWTHDPIGGPPEIYFSIDLAPGTSVAVGEEPALATFDGIGHELVYRRSGSVFQRSRVGGNWSPETQISGLLTGVSAPQVERDAFGAVHAIFLSGGKTWYVRRPSGGGFTAPIEVTPGVFDVTEAQLVVEDGGSVHVFYLSGGDIWRREGSLGIFDANTNLTLTPGDPEDRFAAGVDGLGSLHLAYRRAGLLRYRNNAPPPVAAISIAPAIGEVPHNVTFTDLSTGEIEEWLWQFGDGEVSSQIHPTHVYLVPGNYTITLEVSGPGGTDSITVPSGVQVFPPSNVIRVPSVSVLQGQSNVTLPVLSTHVDPLQGYQNGMIWDPTVLHLQEATIVGTATEALFAEFLVINLVAGPNGPEGLTMGVVFDTIPPFDGRVILPGVDHRTLHLVFDVDGGAPPNETTLIEFVDTFGQPPVLNIFIVGGVSQTPFPIAGEILILPFVLPPPIAFLRGDFESDQLIVISDAINLLAYLFGGGMPPFCADSGDVNDSGTIDLSDPIYLLNFLFVGGNPPPYPWPSGGYDPTADTLPGC